MARNLGTLTVGVEANFSEFSQGMRQATQELEKFSNSMQGLALGAGAAFGVISIAIGKTAGVASEMEENLNVLNVTFKDLTPTVREFAKQTAEATNRSSVEIEKMIASAGALVGPILGNADAAANMSTEMAQLAVDMSSFFNVADTDALNALRSGLIGSSEPLLAYGVDVREGALANFALSQGIQKATKDMTNAEKTTLRLQLIQSQLTNVQGDAANTAQSYANTMKGLRGALIDAQAAIGTALLPTIQRLAQAGLDAVRAFNNLSPAMQEIVSQSLLASGALTGAATALFGIGALVGPVIRSMQGLATAFRAVGAAGKIAFSSILVPMAAIAGIIAGLITIIGAFSKAWKGNLFGIRDAVNDVTEAIVEGFGKALDFITTKFQQVAKTVSKFAATAIGFITGADPDEVGAILREIENSSAGLFSEPVEALKESGSFIADQLAEGGDMVKDSFMEGVGVLDGALKNMGIDVPAAFNSASQKLSGFQDDLFNAERPEAPRIQAGQISGGGGGGVIDTQPIEQMNQEVQNAATMVGGQLVGALGSMGQLAQSAQQGFEQAGPAGAAIAVAADLVSRTEAFGQIVGILDQVVEMLTMVIEPLVAAVVPVVELIKDALTPVISTVANVFKSLAPVIKTLALNLLDQFLTPLRPVLMTLQALAPILVLLAELLGIVANVINSVVEPTITLFADVAGAVAEMVKKIALKLIDIFSPLASLFNTITGFIASIFEAIGNAIAKIPVVGGELAKGARNIAKNLRNASIDIDAMRRAVQGSTDQIASAGDDVCAEAPGSDLCSAVGEVASATGEVASTMASVNGELTNVPSGFKSALAAFEATDENQVAVQRDMPGSSNEQRMFGQITNIAAVNLVNSDPQTLWEQIKDVRERDLFADRGTVVGGEQEFLIPATGGAIP